MIKEKILKIVDSFGYKLVSNKSQTNADKFEGDFIKIYESCKDYTMTSIERMYAIYKSVEYIIKNNIGGDFVECGVWRGGS